MKCPTRCPRQEKEEFKEKKQPMKMNMSYNFVVDPKKLPLTPTPMGFLYSFMSRGYDRMVNKFQYDLTKRYTNSFKRKKRVKMRLIVEVDHE